MYPHRLAVLCLGTFAALSLIAAGCKKASVGSGAPAVSLPSKSEEPPGPSLDETPLAAARQASVNNLHRPNKDVLAKEKLKSISNLAQIGIALHNYETAHRAFPSPGLPKGMKAPDDLVTPHSWRVAILPFIGQQNLWKQIPDEGKGPLPRAVSDTVVNLYLSPFNKEPYRPLSYYRVFVGNGAAFEWGRQLRMAHFTDGLSNTILAVESSAPVDWTSLDDFEYDPKKPLPKLGIFEGGFHALMGDGAVLWIPSDTDEATIRAMITRNGRENFKHPGMVVKPGFIAKKE
jgi:uncharacterized protein DUF1559